MIRTYLAFISTNKRIFEPGTKLQVKKTTSIVKKLIIYLVLFSSILTLIITAFQLFLDYRKDVNLINQSFKQVETSYLGSIRESLWNFDQQQLKTILNGIKSLRDVNYVEIITHDKNQISVGDKSAKNQLSWQSNIYYLYKDENIFLGTLVINASLTEVYSRLLDKIWIILASNALKTFSVSFFIFLLFQRMITRHLRSMTEFTKNISQKEKPENFELMRRKTSSASHDELDLLSNALNVMARDTYLSYSELKEREERFRSLAEHIHEVFWIVSPDWQQVIYISPTYESVWGKSCDSLYENPFSWLDSVIKEDQTMIQKVLQDKSQLEGIETFSFPEYRIQRDDGEILTILARAFPVKDENGNVLKITGIAEDVTELRKNEELLRRTQKLDALGQLTGGIAHDYNNMLGVITGYSELLLARSVLDDKSKKYVEEIYNAAKRGANLTNRLLGFSKHKPSQSSIENLNEIVGNSRSMLEKTLTVSINIHIKLEENIWLTKIDKSAFEDTLINICINAMHAMPEGGDLFITTQNKCLDEKEALSLGLVEGRYILLTIRDTGTGIDNETQMKIFDPFFTTKKDKGTGLGLSQVYGFMLRSNGVIKVNSEPNKGSVFNLYFPICEDSLMLDKIIEEEPDKYSKVETPYRILVVDDEPGLVKLTSEILLEQGYEVLQASNADQALEVLKTFNADAVLSDVLMPGISGYELAEILQERFPRIKIMLMTGFSGQNEPLGPNVIDIIQKPYQASELLSKIKALTEND